MNSVEIIIPIPNAVFGQILNELIKFEEVKFNIVPHQEYSTTNGSSPTGESGEHPFYSITPKEWTEIVVPIMNLTAGVIAFIAALLPFLNRPMTINNNKIKEGLSKEEIVRLIQAELQKNSAQKQKAPRKKRKGRS